MTRHLYLTRHAEADGDLTDADHRQATLLAERLTTVPLQAIHHSPAPRATQTAQLIAAHLPGIQDDLPPDFAKTVHTYLKHFPDSALTHGPWLARRATDHFAIPSEPDTHELIVTHNQIVCWFVRDALQAPTWRWLGINAANAALTLIRYRPNRPPDLVTFNDLAHLPPELRWTGFPPAPRP